MTEILSYLASIAGVAMSLASFSQAYKIYKTKNSNSVSFLTYFVFFIGGLIWMFYGISIKNFPIIISYGPGILSSFFVLVGIIKYETY